MSAPGGQAIVDLLRQLASPDPERAWRDFLTDYGPVLRQVVRLVETDIDAAADCFVFVCERLAHDRFRRLRQFRPEGAASFTTWLRAVTRNLCVDWHRTNYGRVQNGSNPVPARMMLVPVEDVDFVRDPHPNPETRAADEQRNMALRNIVGRLSGPDRLLLRLRYEQDLTLDQIARVTGLKNPQAVDRRLRDILEKIRQGFPAPRGKFRPSSV